MYYCKGSYKEDNVIVLSSIEFRWVVSEIFFNAKQEVGHFAAAVVVVVVVGKS